MDEIGGRDCFYAGRSHPLGAGALHRPDACAQTARRAFLDRLAQERQAYQNDDLEDPRAFGLGVAQLTTPQTGKAWFYEGMTLGYRMLHLYLPKQDAVIAFGLNSQPDSKQNQSGKLMITIFETLHKAGKI